MLARSSLFSLFFFNDTATTEIYTLSLHDALPISSARLDLSARSMARREPRFGSIRQAGNDPKRDRKSTRLNSSHQIISYAVFCLKKKKVTDTRLSHLRASRPHDRHDYTLSLAGPP